MTTKKKTETEENLVAALEEVPPDVPEQRNVYTYQTSSTTEGLMSQEDFYKIKLTS